MTTPNVNIVMPYGVTVEGDGKSRLAVPVTSSSRASSSTGRVSLPAGPCRIAASWNGPESVRLGLAGVGYPLTIPAGGGVPFHDGSRRGESRGFNLPGKRQRQASHEGLSLIHI